MSLIYIILIIIGTIYFSARRFDIISLTFFGLVAYSLPLAFGGYQNMTVLVYFIAIIFLMLISLRSVEPINVIALQSMVQKINWFVISGLVVSFLMVIVDGILTKTSKIDIVASEAGITTAIHTIFLQVSLICLYFNKSKRLGLFIAVNYVAVVLAGDRTQIILSILMIATLYLSSNKLSLLNFGRKNTLLSFMFVCLLIVFGIFGKAIYGMYFQFNETNAFNAEEFQAYIDQSLQKFESVHVMSLLDWVVKDNYRIDSSYLLQTFNQFIPFSFGNEVNSHYIPNYFKTMYFTFALEGYGTSANFYAEGYLNNGMLGAIAFILLHVSLILFTSAALKARSASFVMIGLLSIPVLAFYIHRLSLFQLIAFEKRIIYFVILLTLILIVPKVKIRWRTS